MTSIGSSFRLGFHGFCSLTQRLRQYVTVVGSRPDEAIFFASPQGGAYHCSPIYTVFRHLLWVSRIPHGGRGQGPRLHDLRHNPAYLLMLHTACMLH